MFKKVKWSEIVVSLWITLQIRVVLLADVWIWLGRLVTVAPALSASLEVAVNKVSCLNV